MENDAPSPPRERSGPALRLARWLLRLASYGALMTIVCALAWAWLVPSIDNDILALGAFASIVITAYAAHGGLLALGLAVIALLACMRVTTCVALIAAILALWPSFIPMARSLTDPRARDDTDLVVYSANLLYGRSDIETLAEHIADVDPDVIVFQEVTDAMAEDIERLFADDYPSRWAAPRPDAFGQAVLTRLPVVGAPVLTPRTEARPPSGWVPQIMFDVLWDGRRVHVLDVHTLPPSGRSLIIDQDAMSAAMSELLAESDADLTIFAGDFNSDERGRPVHRLLRAGMRSVWRKAGRGVGGTWQSPGPMSLLPGPRIDQILYTGDDASCIETGRGPFCGSDHRGVWARFAVSDEADRP